MPTISSPLASPAGMPLVNRSAVARAPGFKHLTRAEFDQAVLDERAAIIAGAGLYQSGERLYILGEEGYRTWLIGSGGDATAIAAASHARTVVISAAKSVVLTADVNVMLPTAGIPAVGVGVSGDQAIDRATGIIYAKTSVWAQSAVDGGGIGFTLSGVSGLNQIVTAIIAAGYTYDSVQWKRNTSGTIVSATGAGNTTLAYTQVAADVLPGVKVYPDFVNLHYIGAGLVAPVTVPGAPTIGTATAGNGTATFPFTAPASDGGSAILEYQVLLINAISKNVNAPATSITVTTANGSAVTGAVRARNAIGWGAWSAQSNSVTPAVAVQPLRVVATNQRSIGPHTVTNTTDRKGRIPFEIGSGAVSELVLMFPNRGNGNAGDTSPGVTYNIVKVAIEVDGTSTVVPVLFSGVRTATVPANTIEFMADALLPAAFGLSSFPIGWKAWVRYECTQVSTAGFPGSYMTSQNSGSYGAHYDPAATVISAVDAIGPMVKVSGSNPFTQPEAFAPVVLGRFVSGDPAVGCTIGNSLAWGSNDTATNTGFLGFGVPMRSQYDGSGLNPIAGIVIARSGNTADDMMGSNTASWAYFKYCTHGYEELGTNDVGALSGSTSAGTYTNLLSRKKAIWAGMRAAGIRKIATMVLLPNSSSTDAYVTDTNQTAISEWGSGGFVDQFRDTEIAQVGQSDGVDAALMFNAVRWSGKRWLWGSAPANEYHWGPAQQALAAPELRAFWLS